MNNRIGVFDSGVGGLTVLKELVKLMPNEDYYVFGDTQNMPYGIKSPEEIEELTYKAFKKLEAKGLKAFVIACNTATVYGLNKIKEDTDIPVIGVIQPGIEAAMEEDLKNVLILATDATINSGRIQSLLKEVNNNINVEGIGAADMVLAVENGLANTDEGKKVVYSYLDKAKIRPDGVMLSCTHFPVLKNFIEDYYKEKGADVKLIDPAKKCAELIKEELEACKNLNESNEPGQISYFTSGDVDKYRENGNIILNGTIVIEETNKL